jgi:Protein of unknown function (DUF3780)
VTTSHFPVLGIDIVLQEHLDLEHFVVIVPRDVMVPVSISQHWRWSDSERLRDEDLWNPYERLRIRCTDRSVRALLSHEQWQAIAAPVLQAWSERLKHQDKRPARWKKGATPLSRDLGRELVVLAWGIELADPVLIPIALRNWAGLLPEERLWLYAMVTRCPDAATLLGRGMAWRHALQAALTENPVSDGPLPQTYRVVRLGASGVNDLAAGD